VDGFYTDRSFLPVHLYHSSLLEDDVQQNLFINARNNADRPATFGEVLANNKYNDDSFSPHSLAVPNLHSDFRVSIPLFKDIGLETEVTPEAILQKLTTMKAKMMQVIHRREQSGNGDGQREEMDREFGRPPPCASY
jgi:hypothetical protein